MTPKQARRLAESEFEDGPAPDRTALTQALLEALGDIAAHEEALAVQARRIAKLEAALRQKDWDFAEEQTLRIGVEERFEKYIPDQLSTTQVAAMMGVSRPFVCSLIDSGKLPGRKVGKHRRVDRRDFFAFHRKWGAERESAMAELSATGEDESDGQD